MGGPAEPCEEHPHMQAMLVQGPHPWRQHLGHQHLEKLLLFLASVTSQLARASGERWTAPGQAELSKSPKLLHPKPIGNNLGP